MAFGCKMHHIGNCRIFQNNHKQLFYWFPASQFFWIVKMSIYKLWGHCCNGPSNPLLCVHPWLFVNGKPVYVCLCTLLCIHLPVTVHPSIHLQPSLHSPIRPSTHSYAHALSLSVVIDVCVMRCLHHLQWINKPWQRGSRGKWQVSMEFSFLTFYSFPLVFFYYLVSLSGLHYCTAAILCLSLVWFKVVVHKLHYFRFCFPPSIAKLLLQWYFTDLYSVPWVPWCG